MLPPLIGMGAAVAQTTQNSAAADGIEQVVVTAQRRSENLQDVPLSVTAITADSLAAAGALTPQDVQTVTPGLSIVFSRVAPTPYVRGVGTQNAIIGDEGSVGAYVDGVYIAALSGTLFSFNSIERVEVLKGPQGTLFGRNTTGGLIHVVTQDPSSNPEFRTNLEYGSYDTATARVYASGALASAVNANLSLIYSEQGEGYGKNLTTDEDINLMSDRGVRGKLVWDASTDTSVTFSGDWSERDSSYGAVRQVYPGTKAIGGFSMPGTIYDSQPNVADYGISRQYGGSISATHDFGPASLTSISAARYYLTDYNFDQDATPAPWVDAYHIRQQTKSYQQEFILNGDLGRLNYTAGVFLYRELNYFTYELGSGFAALASYNYAINNQQQTDSYAAFLQGSYALGDATNLTLGARYTKDTRDITGYNIATAGNALPIGTIYTSLGPGSYSQSVEFNKPTWRVALDHRLSDSVMGYVSVSEGFKDGVYNMNYSTVPAVNPETLTAYEAGVKGTFFNQRLQLTAAAFHYDYKDIQLIALAVGGNVIYNAAAGDIDGLELEATLLPPMPIGRLELHAGASLLRAEYSKFPNAPFTYLSPAVCTPGGSSPGMSTGPSSGGAITCSGDASGLDMVNAPRETMNLTADYSIPLGAGEIRLNGSIYYNGGYYFQPDNRTKQPAYSLVNGKLSYDIGNWSFYAFGRNLGDEKYLTSLSQTSFGDLMVAGAPRTWGIGIGLEF